MADIKALIKTKLTSYRETVKIQQEAMDVIHKEIMKLIAQNQRDPVRASSALVLQQNIMRNEGAIKALNELLQEIG